MIIQSKKVWIADQFFAAAIEVEDGKIINVLPYGSKPADADYGDKRIVPGFIDIHCHGAYEFDTNDAHEEGLRRWSKGIVAEGVTGFLATTITQSEEVLTKAVANVAKVMEEGYEGAEILGRFVADVAVGSEHITHLHKMHCLAFHAKMHCTFTAGQSSTEDNHTILNLIFMQIIVIDYHHVIVINTRELWNNRA